MAFSTSDGESGAGQDGTFVALRTPTEVDAHIRPGTRIGDYLVYRFIGMGGMGVVFWCQRVSTGEEVAVKFLVCNPENAAKRMDEIYQEAYIISQLHHDSIVDVQEVCHIDGFTFIVMDLYLGPNDSPVNLLDYARSYGPANGRLEPDDMKTVSVALLEAVDCAHRHGVVHCDLKPENILFDCESSEAEHWYAKLKLTDFGVARIIGEDFLLESVTKSVELAAASTQLSQDVQALVGTYEFMSPEQRRGEPAEPRSDLYTVGLILLKLLTGKGQLSLRMKPSEMREGLAGEWDAIILRALEESVEHRYQSAVEMIMDIASVPV